MPPGLSTATLLLLLCTRAAPTPAPDQYAAPDSLHRVPLYTAGVQPSEPLLPGAAEAFSIQKNNTAKRSITPDSSHPSKKLKNIINFQGDDDLTIDQVKALDNALYSKKHGIKKRDTNLSKEIEGSSNDQQNRNKRDFIHWVGSSTLQTEPSQQTIIHSYQISSILPYYIPIWGNPRRIPIFFPPKPILFNPGYPVRNPPNNNNNGLLPTEAEAPAFGIKSRIGEPDDDPFIWGTVESSEVTGGGAPAQVPAQNRPAKPPTPPLFHSPSNNNNVQQFTTTTIPPPFFRPTSRPFSPPTTTRQPVVQQTRPPQSQAIPPAAQGGAEAPSRCIWAVISCCSPVSTNVRYACFEQLGCPGSFWDQNPCSREITAAALNVAQRFYQQNNAGS